MISGIIAWSVRHRAFVCLATVALALAGAWSMKHTPLDAIPDLGEVQVTLYAKWPGRDPATIQDQVTYPLTTSMLAVPKVGSVRGYSFFGFALTYVVFDEDTDIYWARSRVLEFLSQVEGQLPADASIQLGPDASGVGWVYEYTLEDTSGRYDLGELRALQDWYVRYALTAVDGVAEVASVGGFVRQYQITVDPNRLATYGIPLQKLVGAVKRSNNDVGGRLMEVAETEFMIRGRGYLRSLEDVATIVVATDEHGTPILVRDVAEVAMGPEMRRGLTEKNGCGEVVTGIVVMRHGENALRVIEGVKAALAEVSRGLPDGVVVRPAYDRSHLIHRSIDTLRGQLIEELIVVALACLVFLWHIRSALVAAVTLPLGVLASFIVMRQLGINANIMSLGGIAIALGTMVDAAVVMVENAHKRLEEAGGNPDPGTRSRLITAACQEVGPALFLSLLVITVSFLPVFALRGQAGRLLEPLVYTKTFAMAASAIIAITITPVLIGLFVRGRIRAESSLPVSRLLMAGYMPVIRLALRFKRTTLALAALAVLATLPAWSRLGSEFMPPLDEGDLLYMPTSIPGISVEEAGRTLRIQDALFKTWPEVELVLGKAGRADTATDPAPLSMIETTVTLQPRDTWPARKLDAAWIAAATRDTIELLDDGGWLTTRPDPEVIADAARWEAEGELRRSLAAGVAYADAVGALPEHVSTALGHALVDGAWLVSGRSTGELVALIANEGEFDNPPLRPVADLNELMFSEMDREFCFPGLTNAWTMPIKTRIDMLATGVKTPVGIKVLGPDLHTLERLAIEIERVVRQDPGTLSAIAERIMGGHYLDIDINRLQCARYGLTTGDVQDVIEAAVGGKTVTHTVEGPYRFGVNVRYPRELRDDPDELRRVMLQSSRGEPVPLGLVADVHFSDGPAVIKSEQGQPMAVVYVDLREDQDLGTYVARLQRTVADRIQLPAGYRIAWSGQYEHMRAVDERLQTIVPVTLVMIFLLVVLAVRTVGMALVTMLSLPFALVGGVLLMAGAGYDLSTASAIGFIALAGLAAETAIVMHVYLDIAYRRRTRDGGPLDARELDEAVVEGAVLRVRPKLMTVTTTILGLLPILWATGAGSGPMKRMAAPMIGGLISSTVLTLIIIPVCYAMLVAARQRRSLARPPT